MTFAHTDADGDSIEIGPGLRDAATGQPIFDIDSITITVTRRHDRETATVYITVDRVEEVVAGLRDAARQAAAPVPSGPHETEGTQPDTCHFVDVGGQTIRVRGAGDMSEESRSALAEVVQAAARKFAEDQASIVQRVVDLRRTWCKAGPPQLGTSVSRWWDQRLIELREALTRPPGYPSRLDATAEEAKDRWAHQLVAVLADLDRCEHGRHEGDACGSCGGTSLGNPLTARDRVIGYSHLGTPIVLPTRDHKHDPAAWRHTTTAKDNT